MDEEFNRKRSKQLRYYVNGSYDGSILNVALNVHMFSNGSFEYNPKEAETDYRFLKWILEDVWYEGTNNKEFSQAVKKVIEVAVGEYEKDQKQREESVLVNPMFKCPTCGENMLQIDKNTFRCYHCKECR
jgi:hypothetical protein